MNLCICILPCIVSQHSFEPVPSQYSNRVYLLVSFSKMVRHISAVLHVKGSFLVWLVILLRGYSANVPSYSQIFDLCLVWAAMKTFLWVFLGRAFRNASELKVRLLTQQKWLKMRRSFHRANLCGLVLRLSSGISLESQLIIHSSPEEPRLSHSFQLRGWW